MKDLRPTQPPKDMKGITCGNGLVNTNAITERAPVNPVCYLLCPGIGLQEERSQPAPQQRIRAHAQTSDAVQCRRKRQVERLDPVLGHKVDGAGPWIGGGGNEDREMTIPDAVAMGLEKGEWERPGRIRSRFFCWTVLWLTFLSEFRTLCLSPENPFAAVFSQGLPELIDA